MKVFFVFFLFFVFIDSKIKQYKMNYETKKVHISTIRSGDTVNHGGDIVTVGQNDVKYSSFMGHTLFGDSYRMGTIPVEKIMIKKA
jgi:uncharacterized Zn-binding protein involved in type VI secretion